MFEHDVREERALKAVTVMTASQSEAYLLPSILRNRTNRVNGCFCPIPFAHSTKGAFIQLLDYMVSIMHVFPSLVH